MPSRDSGSTHPHLTVQPGTIRRILRRTRHERVVAPGTVDLDTAVRARAELESTVGVFSSDAGRAELADIHARARFNAGK